MAAKRIQWIHRINSISVSPRRCYISLAFIPRSLSVSDPSQLPSPHRHPAADNDQDSGRGSGYLAVLQTPSSSVAVNHRFLHLQLLSGDRILHRWSVPQSH